ncbi:universal stress protein [Aquimarina sp. RZ0]|uniref:universal stress protein n=1 Tax=Aquimarina sp. RZ0 TaxID=2607730 RepID=UPI0011F3CA6D|nr:universal stress protein [Aquimarina sp. RZ0]KAA1242726.1 universal stress protein [Aquimarina sp. RZ0]
MKRILVPTDFSDNAYSALFYATRLFQNQACQFFILNTFEVNTPVLTSRIDKKKGKVLYQKLSAESQELLAETLHSIHRDTEDLTHTFETLSISKDLIESIHKTIKNKNIDLVVMGTKGATGASALFMGSNAIKVIQKVKNAPIILVPNEYDFEKTVTIAFPTDFRRYYVPEEIKPLVDIASLFKSDIRIFYIYENETLDDIQEYNYNSLKNCIKDLSHSIHWIPRRDEKSKLIHEYIAQLNINLLVMVNYRHSLIEAVTREPVIKKIGFDPSVPFLVIPEAS